MKPCVRAALVLTLLAFGAAPARAQPTLEWIRQFGTTSSEYNYGLAADGAGSVYITGARHIGQVDSEIYVAKYDAAGNSLWIR